MDRNKDNDLTRGEFPGTDEQFAAIDADGDELISAEEALAVRQERQTMPKEQRYSHAISTGIEILPKNRAKP